MNIKREGKKKLDVVYDEDVPLSKRRKESPRSSQPSSPATSGVERTSKRKYDIFDEEDILKKSKDSPRSSQPSSPAVRSPTLSRSTSPSLLRKSDDSDSLVDADELAQEIMDLHCVICTGLDVSPGNQLVECQECHGLYHQECHRPAITDSEVNDPRQVWYCSDCCKTMKKTASKAKPSSNRSSPVTFASKSRSDSPSTVKTGLLSNVKPGSAKKSAPKSTSSSSSSSSSSTTGSSSSTNPSNVNSSLINADKRLQIIKKRAATKLQEKRKPTK